MAINGPDDYSWLFDDGSGYNPVDPGGPGGGSPDSGGGIDYGNYNPTDPGGPGGGAPDPGSITSPGSGISLAQILKMFGGVPGLAGIMAPLIGGIYAKSQTSKANDYMQQAIKDANAQITGTLGGSGAMFAPYQQAGLQGLQRMQNFPTSNFASQYKPLGTGAGLSLGNLARGQ